jgi:hypothetical protein
MSTCEKNRGRVKTFESQYRENAPRRRYAAPKSNAFTLKIQAFVQQNTRDKNFGLDFNYKDAIDFETNFIVNIILI